MLPPHAYHGGLAGLGHAEYILTAFASRFVLIATREPTMTPLPTAPSVPAHFSNGRLSRLVLAGVWALFNTIGVLGSASLVAPGCSSDETVADTGPVHPTSTSFCEAMASAVCASSVVEACFGTAGETETASCVTAFSEADVCNPGGHAYHSESAEACVASFAAVYADGRVSADERASVREACITVFADGGRKGTSCQVDADCDTGDSLRCIAKPGAEVGSCEVAVEVGGGLPCEDAAAVCADTFFCDTSGDTASCIARPAIGASCSAAKPCVEGALCSGALDGICQAKLPNGDTTCLVDEQCVGGFCSKNRGAAAADTGVCAGAAILAPNSQYCDALL